MALAYIRVAQVVAEILVPTAGVTPPPPPPGPISPLKITFRGVKLFERCDKPAEALGPVPVLPPVRRAW